MLYDYMVLFWRNPLTSQNSNAGDRSAQRTTTVESSLSGPIRRKLHEFWKKMERVLQPAFTSKKILDWDLKVKETKPSLENKQEYFV